MKFFIMKGKQNPNPRHSRIRASRTYDCGCMQIIIIDGQLCPWKWHQQSGAEKRKRKKMKPVHHFRYIHSPVKLFWLLSLITCFNIGNHFNDTSNILSEFPCSLMKISHGFNTNKTKNHGSCSHGNHKLTMVLFLQIIIYKEVLR